MGAGEFRLFLCCHLGSSFLCRIPLVFLSASFLISFPLLCHAGPVPVLWVLLERNGLLQLHSVLWGSQVLPHHCFFALWETSLLPDHSSHAVLTVGSRDARKVLLIVSTASKLLFPPTGVPESPLICVFSLFFTFIYPGQNSLNFSLGSLYKLRSVCLLTNAQVGEIFPGCLSISYWIPELSQMCFCSWIDC